MRNISQGYLRNSKECHQKNTEQEIARNQLKAGVWQFLCYVLADVADEVNFFVYSACGISVDCSLLSVRIL